MQVMINFIGGKNMPLGATGNVINTCLLIIKEKGYSLSVEGELDTEGGLASELWIAEKDGFKFMADNGIELLGLIAIYDFKKPKEDTPYWWKIDGPDLWREVVHKTFPD